MKKLNVKLTLLEQMLGTASANPDLYKEFIASKSSEDNEKEEVDSLPNVDEAVKKGTTVFHRTEDGKPFIYDYQIKGFFKDACGMLRRSDDTLSKKLKAYKKEIDGLVFVFPRKILLNIPDKKEIGICQRPLRAQTMQGERISLARSETVPEGTYLEFEIQLLSKSLESYVSEWLDYGKLRGLGQWRNSGMGKFEYEIR